MKWALVVALLVIVWAYLFTRQMRQEAFMDYFDAPVGKAHGPDGVAPEIASFTQPLPLADMLTPETELTEFGYKGAATMDSARQMEMGGQFAQRTNNFRHDYPDNGSAYLAEFDNSMYRPKDRVNTTVPCDAGVVCGP
jgi:hypothetical protein